MMRLRIRAPFAAFRHFTAGSYRPTAPFITPSAAYGLLLNLAGVETRFDDGKLRYDAHAPGPAGYGVSPGRGTVAEGALHISAAS